MVEQHLGFCLLFIGDGRVGGSEVWGIGGVVVGEWEVRSLGVCLFVFWVVLFCFVDGCVLFCLEVCS